MSEAELNNQMSQGERNLSARTKLYSLAIVVIIIFASYLPMLVGNILFTDMGISQNDVAYFLFFPFLSYFIMIFGLIIAKRASRQLAGFEIIWFRKKRSEIIWCFLLPLISIVSIVLLLLPIRKLGMPTSGGTLLLTTSNIFLFFYLLRMGLIGPVVEEIFWRGFIQERLEKVFGAWAALFVQAAAFAGLHFRPIGGFFSVFVTGLIFGFWRSKRKTLIPVIFAHIVLNSLWCVNFLSSRAESAKIKIKTDYVSEFNELSKPVDYDPNDNAAGYYKKAVELCVDRPEALSNLDIRAWPEDLPEEKQVMLEKWFSANSGAIEQLKAGAQKPYYWIERSGNCMYDVLLPELKYSRILAHAICVHAKINALEGNFEEAFSDLLICYKFGKHQSGTKYLIEQLVGIAIKDLAAKTGFQILEKAKMKPVPEMLENFQAGLRGLSSEKAFIDFSGERLIFHDNIQRMFTDDGEGDGYIPWMVGRSFVDPPPYLRALGMLGEGKIEEWERLRRRETVELADEVFEYLNSAGDKTPAMFRNEGTSVEEIVAEITKDNALILFLIPALERCMEMSTRGRANTDALVTTIGLLRYEGDKGAFPNTLEELISGGYIEQLPRDPYSDSPLVYKRIGDGFTLYSVGADFEDNGGVHSKWGEEKDGGDQVFWPVNE